MSLRISLQILQNFRFSSAWLKTPTNPIYSTKHSIIDLNTLNLLSYLDFFTPKVSAKYVVNTLILSIICRKVSLSKSQTTGSNILQGALQRGQLAMELFLISFLKHS